MDRKRTNKNEKSKGQPNQAQKQPTGQPSSRQPSNSDDDETYDVIEVEEALRNRLPVTTWNKNIIDPKTGERMHGEEFWESVYEEVLAETRENPTDRKTNENPVRDGDKQFAELNLHNSSKGNNSTMPEKKTNVPKQ